MSLFKEELYYCKKCGYICFGVTQKKNCPICQSMYKDIVIKGLFKVKKFDNMNSDHIRSYLQQKCNFPPIEPQWEQKREAYCKKRSQQYAQQQAVEQQKRVEESFRQFQYNQAHAPKCPSCGSTNISNIGAVERSISVGVMGLASSKIGKTHKCNNCGTTW